MLHKVIYKYISIPVIRKQRIYQKNVTVLFFVDYFYLITVVVGTFYQTVILDFVLGIPKCYFFSFSVKVILALPIV